jgi:hypothetical protein
MTSSYEIAEMRGCLNELRHVVVYNRRLTSIFGDLVGVVPEPY